MPELPEVETIKIELEKELKGKKIIDAEARLPKMIRAPILTFKKAVTGGIVLNVTRRAKLLIMQLSTGFDLIIHLKMTGQLIFSDKNKLKIGGHPIKDGEKDLPNKYTHVIFYFSDDSKLYFNDLRQFGFIKLVRHEDLENTLEKEKFGPEPLDVNFTLDVFKNLLAKKKASKIKPLLMDQTFIAGLGNLYVAEVCFYAKVKPTKLAKRLKPVEIKKLYEGIKKILTSAIAKKGSSIDTYLDIYGKKGNYIPLLKVYDREGEKCYRCKGKVKMIKLAGRGTYFCPKCQK